MTDNNNTILELENITAGYDDFIAIQNVDFTLKGNDFVGVIGPNGGGKTTLLKVILGLIPVIEGQIHYQFQNNKTKSIGYLPQVSEVDKKFPLSVLQVVLSGLSGLKSLHKRATKQDKDKAISLLDNMGVADYYNKNIGELSGGQMQRVLLARAIISDPELLILDEPNTFVDNQFEADLYEALKDLNERMAILMVSHDVGTIASYVKSIACVNREFHYHESNKITQDQLNSYNCPIQIITHGDVPHTVLGNHHHHHKH